MASFDEDFTKVTDVYSTPLNHFWGDNSQMSLSSAGLLIGSGPNNNFNAMGIMQLPSGTSAGEGFGSFSFIARYEYGAQNGGDYLLLWRADNQWFPTSEPGVIGEADMLETWDASKTEQSTLHFYQATASGGNGQDFNSTTGIDLTKLHVYTFDWHAGQLDFYIDETKIYSKTGAEVPNDFAHGDCNYCMGGGAETETTPVGMYITTAKYVAEADQAAQGGIAGILKTLVARAGSTSTSTGTTTTSSGTGASAPALKYTVSIPSTATGTSPAIVEATITGPDGGTAYIVAVGPASTNYEWGGQPQPVTLDATGKATHSISVVNDGFVKVGSDVNLSNEADSGSITITQAASTGSGSTSTPSGGSTSTSGSTTTGGTPVSGTSNTKLTVNSASGTVGGNAVAISWTKGTGSAATVKADVNGQYVGTLEDNAPDGGPNNATLVPSTKAPLVAGENTVDLYIEETGGNIDSNTFTFTAGAAATTPISTTGTGGAANGGTGGTVGSTAPGGSTSTTATATRDPVLVALITALTADKTGAAAALDKLLDVD